MNLIDKLTSEIKINKKINLILSGGNSPLILYSKLFSKNLNWNKVNIFLLDERLVDIDNINSNYKNIKKILYKNNLDKKLKPLTLKNLKKNNIYNILKLLNSVRTISLVGMGADGHFASIFSKSKNFKMLIDASNKPKYIKISKIGKPKVDRLTMNLSMILISKKIYLLLNNRKKFLIFLHALKSKNYEKYPIFALLQRAKKKIKVYYKSKEFKFKI